MSSSRIAFDHVWKKFHRGAVHDSLRDLIPALARRVLGREEPDQELKDGDFWAVHDLSFEVVPGKCLGIIGANGSGKSTTLKLLTRILEPTRGYCEIRGRAGTLIEVSAGFHGDLTGRENVYLQGAIMGMSQADIARKFDEIVDFAGIPDAIDTPVKRYSSGMNARLGFSIAAHLEPDVLIIDEVLSVGDLSFQDRAFGRIRDLARSGIPVVIVSHQLERIIELCTDAIMLEQGRPVASGAPLDVVEQYVRRYDLQRASLNTGVVVFDDVALSHSPVESGERFALHIKGRVGGEITENIEPLRVRVRALSSGNVVYATGSRWLGMDITGSSSFDVRMELQANIRPGNYLIEVAAQDLSRSRDVAVAPIVMLNVVSTARFIGSVQMNPLVTAVSTT